MKRVDGDNEGEGDVQRDGVVEEDRDLKLNIWGIMDEEWRDGGGVDCEGMLLRLREDVLANKLESVNGIVEMYICVCVGIV